MSPLDEEAAPEGFMKRVTLAPGETLENIDLVGMPDKELLAWLREHTPLKYRIDRFLIKYVGFGFIDYSF